MLVLRPCGSSRGLKLSCLAVSFFIIAVVDALVQVPRASSSSSSPTPIEVSISQRFEGVDGPWSTFEIHVGTPSQGIRVLPGSASTATIAILSESCGGSSSSSSSCIKNRGGVFNRSASSTWKDIGTFYLGFEDGLFNDSLVGDYGFDSLSLGYLDSGSPVMNHSVIAGIERNDFYLGILGLKPDPTNLTAVDGPLPGLLPLLKENHLIPSLSYSYTAGAPYQATQAPGNLILGGYNPSLYTDTYASYGFHSDLSRDLTIGIKAISTNSSSKTSNLLPSGMISSFIDSTVPDIYLPHDACQAFEEALGLEYDETAERYLVSDELHRKLKAENPFINFTITTAIVGGSSYTIAVPYAGFDLTLQPPLAENTTRYFPLRKAVNETQFTLGRTFLQEAYLIVDYERKIFRLHPRLWNSTQASQIVAIDAPKAGDNKDNPDSKKGGLSSGAIAGVSIAAVAVVIMVVIAVVWRFILVPRRARDERRRQEESRNEPLQDKPELASPAIPPPSDMESKSPQLMPSELPSPLLELSSTPLPRETEVYEMMDNRVDGVSPFEHGKLRLPTDDSNGGC